MGRNDIEDALRKLDKLEQGELRSVAAQMFKTTCGIKGGTRLIRLAAQFILNCFGLDAGETKAMVRQIVSKISSRDCSCRVMTSLVQAHTRL